MTMTPTAEPVPHPTAVRFPNERLPGRVCPACSADGLRAFYEVAGTAGSGGVHLALCETCGLVSNVAFDERRATTRVADPASARTLAERWAARRDLVGKTLVEIGCGQGEFLERLCQVAGCRGIGFDPAVGRDRGAGGDVMFVPDRFEPYAGQVPADVIVCRQWLDRIAEPLALLTCLRENLRDTPLLRFQVPDARPMLEGGAFEDVDGGRHGYFTAESLTRVFQRAGFEVCGVAADAADAADRTLTIDAVPTGGQKRDMPTLAELRLAAQFVRVCRMRMKTPLGPSR